MEQTDDLREVYAEAHERMTHHLHIRDGMLPTDASRAVWTVFIDRVAGTAAEANLNRQEQLAVARHLIDAMEGSLHALVQAAREDGMPWREVGDALGVTMQAAQQRYGRE